MRRQKLWYILTNRRRPLIAMYNSRFHFAWEIQERKEEKKTQNETRELQNLTLQFPNITQDANKTLTELDREAKR